MNKVVDLNEYRSKKESGIYQEYVNEVRRSEFDALRHKAMKEFVEHIKHGGCEHE